MKPQVDGDDVDEGDVQGEVGTKSVSLRVQQKRRKGDE
jgi:hypothetical protein